MNENLMDKLRALGVQLGAREVRPAPKVEKNIPIEEVLPIDDISTAFGPTLSQQEAFAADYSHGRLPLAQAFSLDMLREWAKTRSLEKKSTIFLDTETSGLAGGTGTFAFMVGLGYWRNEDFYVQQLFMRDPSAEPALLAGLGSILDPFETIVTFNGKSFDVPLLNSRYVLNGMTSPLPDLQHVDLLTLSRQVWRNRLSDRSLGSLEGEVLGFSRGQAEIPGWMVPEIYYEYLRSGDARPLSGVFYHNKIDILSLAGLFVHTSQLLTDPSTMAANEGLDIIGLARIFERMGNVEQAIRLYEIGLESGLPRPFFIQTLYRFAELSRRNGNWPTTIKLWEKAAEYGEVNAAVELAKYYEHQTKNIPEAQCWTALAEDNLSKQLLPAYLVRDKAAELEKRKNRLFRKGASRVQSNQKGCENVQ